MLKLYLSEPWSLWRVWDTILNLWETFGFSSLLWVFKKKKRRHSLASSLCCLAGAGGGKFPFMCCIWVGNPQLVCPLGFESRSTLCHCIVNKVISELLALNCPCLWGFWLDRELGPMLHCWTELTQRDLFGFKPGCWWHRKAHLLPASRRQNPCGRERRLLTSLES